MKRLILLTLTSLLLTNCAVDRSTTGAILGAGTATSVCVQMGVSDPYVIASCALVGGFKGADLMYQIRF
jgi:hypothetical protein